MGEKKTRPKGETSPWGSIKNLDGGGGSWGEGDNPSDPAFCSRKNSHQKRNRNEGFDGHQRPKGGKKRLADTKN